MLQSPRFGIYKDEKKPLSSSEDRDEQSEHATWTLSTQSEDSS